jgi:hypothetical protein
MGRPILPMENWVFRVAAEERNAATDADTARLEAAFIVIRRNRDPGFAEINTRASGGECTP